MKARDSLLKHTANDAANELPISRLRGRKNSLLTGKRTVVSLISRAICVDPDLHRQLDNSLACCIVNFATGVGGGFTIHYQLGSGI